MSIPIPGTYRIRSVPYPNQMLDLAGGSDKTDTPVAGYGNNHYNQNMLVGVDSLSQNLRLMISTVDRASSPRDRSNCQVDQRPKRHICQAWERK